jgi:hypothetical protein
MRLLEHLLTGFGAACMGLAIAGLALAVSPFRVRLDPAITTANCTLFLMVGVTSLIIAYGIHRRSIIVWWLGWASYILLVGYFVLRTVHSVIDMSSFLILNGLIGIAPFAALWWRYEKGYFGRSADSDWNRIDEDE